MVFILTACSAATVRLADGTELPADVYAHSLSVQAYTAQAGDSAACYARAETDIGLAICGLASARGTSAAVPTFQRGPTGFDRVLATVQTLAPLGLGFLQYKQADQANERAYLSSIRLSEISANREAAVVGSVAGLGSAGFSALQGTATAGLDSTAAIAGAGFASLERLGAGSASAWAEAIAQLPPTTAISAGGNIAIAGGDQDQSSTGGHRVSGTGNEVDTSTVTDCVATANAAPANASATGQPGASGTTGGQNASTNPSATASTGAPIASTHCQPRGG